MRLFNMRWLPKSVGDISRLTAVQNVQGQLVDQAIIASAVIGLPAVLASIWRIQVIGWHSFIALHISLYLIVVATALWRRKLALPYRAAVLLGIPYILATSDLISWGLIDMGIPFLMIFIILTTILFGARCGTLTAIIGLTTLVTIASAVCAGIIRFDFDANAYLHAPSAWMIAILVTGLFAFIIVGATGRLYGSFVDSISTLDRQASELRRSNELLGDSEKRYRSLHDNVPVGVFRTTLDGRIVSFNPALVNMLGYRHESELLAQRVSNIYQDPEQRDRIIDRLKAVGSVVESEIEFRRKDGSVFWASISASLSANASGRISFIDGIVQNISDRKKAEMMLTEAYGQLEQTVASRTADLTAANDLLTKEIEERQRLYDQLQESRSNLETANRELESAVFRANQMAADAEIRSYQLEQEIERRRQSEAALRENEEKLVYLAYHDALTGLNNRKAFHEKLEQSFQYARRYQTEIALIFIDIDHFKTVNDSLGHEFGDELLKEIARRLKRSVRETDVLSRIGGDEFTIILNNPDKIDSEAVAARINDTLARPYALNDVTIDYISASLGISSYPRDADQIEGLIKTADTAMYQAKEKRNQFRRYGT